MASSSDHGAQTKDDLFTGLKFWLSRQVPMRSHFEEKMKERGATMVTNESDADMRIVDDARKNIPVGPDSYSYRFVDDSMKNNRLEDLSKYAVGLKSAADRPVGSMNVAAKRTRRPFSRADDQILFNWLEPYRQAGGAWKGNKIYEQLERKYPQHSFQSWRSRYLFIVEKCTKMTVTEHIDPFAISDNEDIAAPQERSPKRRRLNGPQSATAPIPPTIPTHRALSVHSQRATSPRSSSPRAQQARPIIAASERNPSAHENTVRHTEKVTELQIGAPNELTNPRALVEQDHKYEVKEEDKHGARGQRHLLSVGQVSLGAKNNPRLISSVDGSTEQPHPSQIDPVNGSSTTLSELPKFTDEETKSLFRAVPYIHYIKPQNLASAWEEMVQEMSQHTVAEWRFYYETAVLPEYMRRHKLKTMEELEEFVADVVAEDQLREQRRPEAKKEQAQGDVSPAANRESDDPEGAEEETTIMSPILVPLNSSSRDHTSTRVEIDVSANLRQSSPSTKPQTILRVVEVRQNGNIVAQQSSEVHPEPQPSQPPTTQSSMVSPKKRLFGRTLDATMISSQLQIPKTTTNSTHANGASFSTASTTSAIASLTSQSVSSSKRLPESGQRPPKSVTKSQEELVAYDTAVQEQTKTSDPDILPGPDAALSDVILDALPTSPNKSPALDLLWGEIGQPEPIPSSPDLSDTGSEYIAFDTAPKRSQLWEVDENKIHDESDRTDGGRPRISQPSNQRTPGKGIQRSSASRRVATPNPPTSSSEEDDLVEERTRTEAQMETGGSPEIDVQAITAVKVVPRTETQKLFDQSVPEIEEDPTIFDLPPPEGGWEQFSDIEDESEDIHASVEVADLDLPEREISSLSSETNEVAAETLDAEEHRPDTTVADEILVISDHESEFTTSSGNQKSPTPNEVRVQQQKRPVRSVSDDSERTISSSRTASSRVQDEDEANTETSSTSSDDQSAIESWFSNQPELYNTVNADIVSRLASTSLQATILNLSAATFTLRDMVASFQRSEETRRAQFHVDTRIKREHTDSTAQPRFKPKTRLTEEEARSFLPQDVLGVWTIEDDRSFLSQTIEGLETVKGKHGAAGVRKRAKFLRIRYGEGAVNVGMTPKSRLGSARKQR